MNSSEDEALLRRVGGMVRLRREALGLSRRDLADRCGLSVRFLAQVEAGAGNPAITRLARIAKALEVRMERLLSAPAEAGGDDQVPIIALVGLRGAGKSTLGRLLATDLGYRFVEQDGEVEARAGMPLPEIFALEGVGGYQRWASQVATELLARPEGPTVLATAGGVVSTARIWERVKRRCLTVWLSATPEEHFDRVVAQGDRRPMANRPDARESLRRLLQQREPLYAECDLRVDTSQREVNACARALLDQVRERLTRATGTT